MCCRFSLLSVMAAVFCGALVFFFYRANAPAAFGAQSPDTGYAILTFDASRDDRGIREALARGGLEGIISESSQEVPLDDFGFLRMVPLDRFRDKIEPFDPRDTGYAERLRSFFVRDGQRFFFLPLYNVYAGSCAALSSQIAALLPDLPFTLTVPQGQGRPLFWYFALLAAACIAALLLSRSRRFFALALPVLLAFGWNGPLAFIMAAALAAILELLREPLGELTAARRYRRHEYTSSGFSGVCLQLKPFKANAALALIFLVFFAAFSLAAGISPVPPLAALCVLYVLVFRLESARTARNRHVLFIPVLLLPFTARTFSLFPLLVPFGIASVLALFVPDFPPPREAAPPIAARYLVRAEEYYRHLAFQKSFSFRRLDEHSPAAGSTPSWPLIQEGFLRYYLGGDGLIAGSAVTAVNLWEAAPFPLEKLNSFLLHYGKESPVRGTSFFAIKEWILVAMILTAWILNFFRPAMRPWSERTFSVSRKKRLALWSRSGTPEQAERRFPSC